MPSRNPPQPDETPLQNVAALERSIQSTNDLMKVMRNAMALLAPIVSHPDLFGALDTRQAIQAALVRLERVVEQLDRR